MIKILIADDHAVVREGIKRILADIDDLVVVGEAGTPPELLAAATRGEADILLMDLAMPGASGLELLHDLRRQAPDLPVLVLSMYPEEQYAVRALMAGASGYINKGSPPTELIRAIRTVAAGHRYITPKVADNLASHVAASATRPQHATLSNREYQVLCLIASGKSVGDIARELSLSVKTISTFRSRILRKLSLRHNADLTRYALKHGLVE